MSTLLPLARRRWPYANKWLFRRVIDAILRVMDASKARHIAQYGTVKLERAYCQYCQQFAIIIDDVLQCCDRPCLEKPTNSFAMMSEAPIGRRGPSKLARKKILNEQDHRCFYCLKRFGSLMWRGARELRLRIEWDHSIPYSYSRSNREANFVAACQLCNRFKGSRLFSDVYEVRLYVEQCREAKGYSDVRPLLKILPSETPTSEIL
jgi:5-methylcytosine-specific restriction endonuclease McrA